MWGFDRRSAGLEPRRDPLPVTSQMKWGWVRRWIDRLVFHSAG